MKKICLLMAAMAVCAGAAAQDVSIGLKGGMSIPNITPGGTKTPLSEGYSSRLAGAAGVFTDLQFTRTFSLQIGLEYSGQGGQKNGSQAVPTAQILAPMAAGLGIGLSQITGNAQLNQYFPTDIAQLKTNIQTMQTAMGTMAGSSQYLYANFDAVVKFNYLMLPVQAKFGWNINHSPWRVYVSAGLFGSYLVNAKRVSTGSSSVYMDAALSKTLGTQIGPTVGAILSNNLSPQFIGALAAGTPPINFPADIVAGIDTPRSFSGTQDITGDIKRFNVGFVGAVGVQYRICCRHSIFLEGGGNYGFIKIQKSEVNGQNRIGAGSIMLGYSYKLGSKNSCVK